MISTLDLPKAVHRVAVAQAVTQRPPVQPGTSRKGLSLPPGSAKHPYRIEMRMWALFWRGQRRAVTADDRAYATHCLNTAITFNRWHVVMVAGRAGA